MNRPTLASQPPAPPRPAGRPAEPRVPAPPSPSRPPPATRVLRALAALASAWWLSMPAGAAPASAAQPASAPVSATAKQVFERSKGQLLQIRTLLKTQDSQASVGSGFLVDDQGLVITNYHVVSGYALDPDHYRLRYASTDEVEGELTLLAIDVRHDLALLRADAKLKGRPGLGFRPASQPLLKGDKLFSLGNPHDVAFAVVEGNYNGLVERSFDPLIYYAGGINPGMSGGPVLDDEGRVTAINVSLRMFSQQMSFLVPGEFAQALIKQSGQKALTRPVWPQVRDQLKAYQQELVDTFLRQPWRSANHARYRLPVPQESLFRCWGASSGAEDKGMEYQRTQCRKDHGVFVNDGLQVGLLQFSHEVYDGRKLGTLRFSQAYTDSFRNERLGGDGKWQTGAFCSERSVDQQGLPLRAVVCLRAHKKLEGLYDLNVLVVTRDQATEGALGRFDATGISFDNAKRLTAHYLGGFGWTTR